jgi:hypothetical protein
LLAEASHLGDVVHRPTFGNGEQRMEAFDQAE